MYYGSGARSSSEEPRKIDVGVAPTAGRLPRWAYPTISNVDAQFLSDVCEEHEPKNTTRSWKLTECPCASYSANILSVVRS